jgi:hypothetical protein
VSKTTPALILDITLALWTAAIITPITAPFAILFKRSGPTNMAHSVIDEAHIAAQQNRISALATRLHKEWILPEPEETGNNCALYLALIHVVFTHHLAPLDEPHDVFVIKEKWGKGDSVPDTQIFKLDFTKSARYHKRKIKLVRRGSGTAWQDGAPAIAESPPSLKKSPIVPDSQIFKLDFTKSSKYHKRKIKLVRRGSQSAESPAPLNPAAAAFMSHLNPKRAGTLKKLKKSPTFVIPVQNNGIAAVPEDASSVEDRMNSEPPKKSRSKKIKRGATHRITDSDGAAKAGETATDHDKHFEAKDRIVRKQTTTLTTKPTSLMEEGLNYRKLARAATKDIKLVGTVHSDGTVQTKRRWFCFGRRALNVAEQQAIARTVTKKVIDTKIDETLILAMRDRVRRSHRNARFHRSVLFFSPLCSLFFPLCHLSSCFFACLSVYLSACRSAHLSTDLARAA